MKFKYFMRGLGVGILFCTLIIFAAYETSPNKLFTDEEVIARAKQLGMVEGESSLDKVLKEASTSGDTSEEAGTPEDLQTVPDMDGSHTGEPTTKEQDQDMSKAETGRTTETVTTTENRQEPQEKQPTTADKTETKPPTETEAPETAEDGSQDTAGNTEDGVVTKTITVKRGMDSSSVAALLQREGIIEDAHDFDSYLDKNGYSTKIRIGTYVVKSSDSYKTLAKIITKTK